MAGEAPGSRSTAIVQLVAPWGWRPRLLIMDRWKSVHWIQLARRTITVEVAGIPALLVAKAHKIHDRLNDRRGTRVVDKDAADVFRMMQVANVGEVAAALAALMEDVIAGEVTQVAIEYLVELFIRPGSPGVLMASQALQLEVPRERIAAVANRFAYQLRASTP